MRGHKYITVLVMLAAAMLSACSAADTTSESESVNDTLSSYSETSELTGEDNAAVISEFDAKTVSENLCNDMVQENFTAAYLMFSDEMKQLSEEQLKAIWQQTTAPLGKFVGYVDCTLGNYQEYTVADSRLEFEHGYLTVQIAYSDEGIIEGLYFLYPEQ